MSSAIPDYGNTVILSNDCCNNLRKILSYYNSHRRFSHDFSLKEMTVTTAIETLVERQATIIDLVADENLCICPICTSHDDLPDDS